MNRLKVHGPLGQLKAGRRGIVDVFGSKAKRNSGAGTQKRSPNLAGTPSVSDGIGAVVYHQEGKMVDFYMKDDVQHYFKLPANIEPLQIEETPLPEKMLDEMWRYSNWHSCFTGTVERKEETGRKTEFVQFLFERLGERYKFITKNNVALRSRHSWGQATCTLSYPRGNFCVVHFVTDFNQWNTTETVGQYPKLWPKAYETLFLYMDMAAHENYRIGMGAPKWGVVTDGIHWRIVEQCATSTGAWDGRQHFKQTETFHLQLPLQRDGYAKLTAWLNHIFVHHAPIDSSAQYPSWKKARKKQNEPPDEIRHNQLRDVLAGLGDI
ncbi:hypothetical protein DIPPA_22816 [Diplonema papillatum]|nr:hypothetical protein DIPPA_22816 [Diplonema papillatum]